MLKVRIEEDDLHACNGEGLAETKVLQGREIGLTAEGLLKG